MPWPMAAFCSSPFAASPHLRMWPLHDEMEIGRQFLYTDRESAEQRKKVPLCAGSV